MPLINCKIHLELVWTKNRVKSDHNRKDNDDETTFKITIRKLYVPIITLGTRDDVKLTKQLNERFKTSVYWNQYKTEMKGRELDNNSIIRILRDAIFEVVKKLFNLAFNNTTANDDDNPINIQIIELKEAVTEIFSPISKYN